MVGVVPVLKVVRSRARHVSLPVLVNSVGAGVHMNLRTILESRRKGVCVRTGLACMTLSDHARSVLTTKTPLGRILFGSVESGLILARRSLIASLLLTG